MSKGSRFRTYYSEEGRDTFDTIFRKARPIVFVIRYSDGAYNYELGHPTMRDEATRYTTRDEAERVLSEIEDGAIIEELSL